MNMVIIQEMQQQRKQFDDQHALILSHLSLQSSTAATNESSTGLSSRLVNKNHGLNLRKIFINSYYN